MLLELLVINRLPKEFSVPKFFLLFSNTTNIFLALKFTGVYSCSCVSYVHYCPCYLNIIFRTILQWLASQKISDLFRNTLLIMRMKLYCFMASRLETKILYYPKNLKWAVVLLTHLHKTLFQFFF